MKTPRRLPLHFGFACCLAIAVLHAAPLSARSLIEAGAATEWKFRDDGVAPPKGWMKAGFDDSKWKSGQAPLGYGEKRLGTLVQSGTDSNHHAITTWFRREFDAASLQPGERLALLLCMDDGAVIYLNGKEIGRANLPTGALDSRTLARRAITDRDEGFYFRVPVPGDALRAGKKNVLAVEVHQASTNDADLFFDVALKVVPPVQAAPQVAPAAQEIMNSYHKKHWIAPGVKVPDGYLDGGRHMKLDAAGRATSGREILLVDRARDNELARHLDFARSADLRQLPALERTQKLAAYIDGLTTPPGGARWVGQTIDQLTRDFVNQPLLLGDVLDQCQAGVCRHRALLFKVLADEAGLSAALVRGNYLKEKPPGFAHAWNEVHLEDGRHLLVDVMHHGGKAYFPETTDPKVVQHYAREDDTPWYRLKTDEPTAK